MGIVSIGKEDKCVKINRLLDLLYMLILVMVGIIFILPLAVTFANSFMSETEITMNYTSSLSIFDILNDVSKKTIHIRLIPSTVTFTQYITILIYQPTFLMLLVNSMKIAFSDKLQYRAYRRYFLCP